jgi:hypothetical protein
MQLEFLKEDSMKMLEDLGNKLFLGYQGFVINPVSEDANNTQYTSNVAEGGIIRETYSSGYNGKLSFNAATSYKDKLYMGINLNSHLQISDVHLYFMKTIIIH